MKTPQIPQITLYKTPIKGIKLSILAMLFVAGGVGMILNTPFGSISYIVENHV